MATTLLGMRKMVKGISCIENVKKTIQLEELAQLRRETILKWRQSGFLDGLQDAAKESIAQLYENQSRVLLNE